MRFLVIGASGRSGQLVVEEALSKGHVVTALVRKPTSLPHSDREGLTLAVGSPLNQSDITNAINCTLKSKVDVVLFTMSARQVGGSPFGAPDPVDSPPRLMADSVQNTITAMKSAAVPVRKLVVMSSAGIGESWESLNCLMRLAFTHTNMKFSRDDHNAVYEELKNAEGIVFVSPRPWMLTDTEAMPVKVYPDCGKGSGFMSKISRASVAKFMVEAAETTKYDGRSPVISN